MNNYDKVKNELRRKPKIWLITGVAGFIGSNLLEALLNLNQKVVGIDNFSTGHVRNLEEVKENVGIDKYAGFELLEGDIGNFDTCRKALNKVEIVLHQAAMGSVPRSIEDPLKANEINVTGFVNMIISSKEAGAKRFVFASSSSVYGDLQGLPQREEKIGQALSPYAITKYINELYADIFARTYDLEYIGLRYFNIFGPRQDPDGDYAAVIPKWFSEIISQKDVYINGDGKTSRDFCYIDNCVQCNLLAALTKSKNALNRIYNVSFGQETTLEELFFMIRACVSQKYPEVEMIKPKYRDFRPGDVRRSLADITRARDLLGYNPEFSVQDGLEKAADWYINLCLSLESSNP